jgi:iron-sulfur cluster repair protein YtfE (RIC family)
LRVEEQTLFPACRALCAPRELAGGYNVEHALCGTHRALLQSLRAFELALHQHHLHEENNMLSRACASASARATGWY